MKTVGLALFFSFLSAVSAIAQEPTVRLNITQLKGDGSGEEIWSGACEVNLKLQIGVGSGIDYVQDPVDIQLKAEMIEQRVDSVLLKLWRNVRIASELRTDRRARTKIALPDTELMFGEPVIVRTGDLVYRLTAYSMLVDR